MTAPVPEPPRPYATGHCYRHPDRETNIACSRCERPICPDCMNSASVGFQCPSCVRETRGRTPTLAYGGGVSQRTGAAAFPVTIALLAVNVLMYVVTAAQSSRGLNDNQNSRVFVKLVLNPDYIASTHQYGRLVGAAFLHYGIIHLLVNMVSLVLLGPGLEKVFGWARFLALYLIAAVGSSVAVYLFSNPAESTVGASGAIFGLFGALIIVYRRLGLDMRALLPTIIINVVLNVRLSNLSWQGHLGGLVIGALVAAAFVYAPRERRSLVQVGAGAVLLVAFVGLTLMRTSMLNGG